MSVASQLAILGAGYHVPERVVDNAELVKHINTTEEFILRRTGVRERRHALAHQSLNELIVPAAELALARAGLHARDLDMIIVSTLSPDYHDPSQACRLQAALGARTIPAFDIRAQCSGMLYGMELARAFVQSRPDHKTLLVCAEMLSKRIDPSDAGRNLAILLGDGAGALVLGQSPDPTLGLVDLRLGADGRYFELLHTAAPGSRNPHFLSQADLHEGRHHFRMQGAATFEHASHTMVAALRELLDAHAMTPNDLDLLVPHQPNVRLLEHVFRALEIAPERCVVVAEQFGNVASASLPIALAWAIEQRRLHAGQTIAFLAYGAGATWGAALYRS